MERLTTLYIDKESHKFSAAHYTIFSAGERERLHGHNYHVSVDITGDLTDRGLVIDFNLAKPIVREICDELDEHWLIPGEHPELKYEPRDDGHTAVIYCDAHYLVPSDEVRVLPFDPSKGPRVRCLLQFLCEPRGSSLMASRQGRVA